MALNFDFFYKWAKRSLNIDLNSYKEKQLQRRIETVMKNAGVTNLEDYAKKIEADKEIREIFLDYITINVTEFFRNRDIFEDFEDVLVNQLAKEFRNLKIWSAACSIGSEPYTIAMILDKHNLLRTSKIIATDIDEGVLNKAKSGAYSKLELKGLKDNEISQYFTLENKEYLIDNKLKRVVNFKNHDLLLDRYESGFHAIVCRNVTIYFKNEAKDQIYRKMYDALVPGGILFTGATESIYNPQEFGFEKMSTFIYQKVDK